MERVTEAELKMLKYMLTDIKYVVKFNAMANEHYFKTAQSNMLYQAIASYYRQYKDLITEDFLQKGLKTMQQQKPNLYTAICDILNKTKTITVNNEAEFEAYFLEVEKEYKQKSYFNLAEYIIANNNINDVDKIANVIKEQLLQLDTNNSGIVNEGSVQEHAMDRLKQYNDIKENPDSLKLIPTGFKHIDDLNGGFAPGTLIYVIGRKGDGKSLLLLNFAVNMWLEKKNIILFSLEISQSDYERRFDSRAALLPSNGIKRGLLKEDEEKKYKYYLENIAQGKGPAGQEVGHVTIVDIPGKCTPSIVEQHVKKVEEDLTIKNKIPFKFDVIIVDYSQIMSSDIAYDAKRDQLGSIALSLKQLARKTGTVVISAAQMNRVGKSETDSKNNHSDTSHVAESDQISDHLDSGIAIRSINDDEAIIESFKERDGSPFRFKIKKNYSCMNMIEVEDNWDTVNPDQRPVLGSAT